MRHCSKDPPMRVDYMTEFPAAQLAMLGLEKATAARWSLCCWSW